jgi:hypothetical protein
VRELSADERRRVLPLIRNECGELSVPCVIHGSLPGRVFVDDARTPTCGLVRTTECNLLFGAHDNPAFNREVRDLIGYFDQLTGDHEGWEETVFSVHPNNALRRYGRELRTLTADASRAAGIPGREAARIIHHEDLGRLSYANKELVAEWVQSIGLEAFPRLPVAALIVEDDLIVSCSAVDCRHEGRMEIGVKTLRAHRRKGHGLSATAALVDAAFRGGVKEIGWHCVETNAGSRRIAERCGFGKARAYHSFSPFPPVENVTDLSTEQWVEYARFLEGKAVEDANQRWQAALCWAKAGDMGSVIACLRRLRESGRGWFMDEMAKTEGLFDRFTGEAAWDAFMGETIRGH